MPKGTVGEGKRGRPTRGGADGAADGDDVEAAGLPLRWFRSSRVYV